ncbi:MAG: hypothetical protein JWR01_1023, partial [Subtercola sp.]|nr:hypothetical protein [Subtercola sp.]
MANPQADGLPDAGHDHTEACLFCGLDLAFEMPEGLVHTASHGDVVIFAGAGVSTEVPAVFPSTFYEQIRGRLSKSDDDESPFPELMADFEERFGRGALLRGLKQRLNYVDSFTTLSWQARKFHRELATMPYLRDVITTNWDTYFEEECLATPFVTGADFAFHDMPGRRVYKIHGSMTSLSTLVITQGDYERRLEELRGNALGGVLRQLLATKTVVFAGYSLRDWNFRLIYDALHADMGPLAPRAYFVSPFPSAVAEELHLHLIKTSGVHFLRQLKQALAEGHFLLDQVYERIDALEEKLLLAQEFASGISLREYPAVVHCWAYQEGLLDAFGRIRARRRSGEYSDGQRVAILAQRYDELGEAATADGRYFDASYIEGYLNGLVALLPDEAETWWQDTPLYLVYGSDDALTTEPAFLEALKSSRRRAPKARAEAKELAARCPEGMVLKHGPFLPDVPSQEW